MLYKKTLSWVQNIWCLMCFVAVKEESMDSAESLMRPLTNHSDRNYTSEASGSITQKGWCARWLQDVDSAVLCLLPVIRMINLQLGSSVIWIKYALVVCKIWTSIISSQLFPRFDPLKPNEILFVKSLETWQNSSKVYIVVFLWKYFYFFRLIAITGYEICLGNIQRKNNDIVSIYEKNLSGELSNIQLNVGWTLSAAVFSQHLWYTVCTCSIVTHIADGFIKQ